jgi:hypothetical protein
MFYLKLDFKQFFRFRVPISAWFCEKFGPIAWPIRERADSGYLSYVAMFDRAK